MQLCSTYQIRFRATRTNRVLLALCAILVGTPPVLEAQDAGIHLEPHVGILYRSGGDLSNGWGGLAGLQIGVNAKQNLSWTGTLNYSRINSAMIDWYNSPASNGVLVYDRELVGVTGGLEYDLFSMKGSRIAVNAEIGLAGERDLETERRGEINSAAIAGDDSFGFGPAGLLGISFQEDVTSDWALTVDVSSYLGIGGAIPYLAFGVIF